MQGVERTFFNAASPFAIKDRIEKDGAEELRDVMPRWKPWIPPRLDQGLQQGGLLIFEGNKQVFTHYDEATGAHADLQEVLSTATQGL